MGDPLVLCSKRTFLLMGRSRRKRKIQFCLLFTLLLPICSVMVIQEFSCHPMIWMIQAQLPGFQITGKIRTGKNSLGRRRNQKPVFLLPVSTAALWSHAFSLGQQSLNSSGTVSDVQQREGQVPELSGSEMTFLGDTRISESSSHCLG